MNHGYSMFVAACIALVGASCAAPGRPVSNAGDRPADPIPGGLEELESLAEDSYDHALAGNMAELAGDADAIAKRWNAVRAQLVADGASDVTLNAVDAAVDGFSDAVASTTSELALARAANAISAHMDQLFALYGSPVPPSVLKLDYYGREIVLDARDGRFLHAMEQLGGAECTFDSLRAALVAAGGSDVALAYAEALEIQRNSITSQNADALEQSALEALELVDGMEQAFYSSR